MSLTYSFIIPVFNRPDEVFNLLKSLSELAGNIPFEVVIIEDGSRLPCEFICDRFRESVTIQYHFKDNTGPGDSRNHGMRVASGNYFIILDSDCIVPPHYLKVVDGALKKSFVHCYGGPDAAIDRFTPIQKAINYAMTSFFTTGGLRGGNEQLNKFQPRSFNMGLSKEAFEATGGFGSIHPGEDPDLVLRLWKAGYDTLLIKDAFVFHERRVGWDSFYKQVFKFGQTRVILNKWHPESQKLTYYFPSFFVIGLFLSVVALFFNVSFPSILYLCYFLIILVDSSIKNSFIVGFCTVPAVLIQFTGYGLGFLVSFYKIVVQKMDEEMAFPGLFFKPKK